jgi:hypothetical protein
MGFGGFFQVYPYGEITSETDAFITVGVAILFIFSKQAFPKD